MTKIKIFTIIFLLVFNFNNIVFSVTLSNRYIVIDSSKNYEKARLNRAKLSTLSNAKIIILSSEKVEKKELKRTARYIQKEKLMEHFFIFKKINKKENFLEKKENYAILLGPENNERIKELSKILTNLKYTNFHVVSYKGNLQNKKKEKNDFLTIDPRDFNLPKVEQERIYDLSN